MLDRESHLGGYAHTEVVDARALQLMQETGTRHGFNVEVVAREGEQRPSYESLTGRQQPLQGDCRGSHHLTIAPREFDIISPGHVQVLITSDQFDPSGFWTDFINEFTKQLESSYEANSSDRQ